MFLYLLAEPSARAIVPLLVALAFPGVATLLIRQRPGNPIGWILFSFGLGVPFSILANSYGARILPGLAPILDALFLTGLLLLATGALAAFAQIARDEVNLETLTTELLHVVETTIQPEQVSLWLKPTE